jgi:hypothetical protein
MNKISLEKIDSSSRNCLHVKMLINDNDVGVLYLKGEEVDILIKTLKRGIYSSEVKLESNIFDDEDDFDDNNNDEIE